MRYLLRATSSVNIWTSWLSSKRSLESSARSPKFNSSRMLLQGPRQKGKMKAIQCAALLLATAALLGCAPIDKLRQQDAQVAPDTVAPATLLKAAVLEDLRLRGQDPAKNFGAFFVYVDKTEIPFFEKLFKDNIPRAEFSSGSQGRFANLDDSDGGVTDRRTGKPGAIFGFPKVEIRNGRAYV